MVTYLPSHKHRQGMEVSSWAPRTFVPHKVEGCPTTLESAMHGLQHLPLILLPIVGLVYAAVMYGKYKRACQSMERVNGFTPSLTCPTCKETAISMKLPIVVGIIGGLGLFLPVFLLMVPILLIVGIAKAILDMGSKIKSCCMK